MSNEPPRMVNLLLDRYEAKELADYLSGEDMHLSIGDRLFLARRLHRLLEEGASE